MRKELLDELQHFVALVDRAKTDPTAKLVLDGLTGKALRLAREGLQKVGTVLHQRGSSATDVLRVFVDLLAVQGVMRASKQQAREQGSVNPKVMLRTAQLGVWEAVRAVRASGWSDAEVMAAIAALSREAFADVNEN